MKAKNKSFLCIALLVFFTGASGARGNEAPGGAGAAGADDDVAVAVEQLGQYPRASLESMYARARAAAWLRALDKAALKLPDRRDLRLAALDREGRQALAAQIYAVAVQPPEPQTSLPHVVVILQPRVSLQEDMASALHRPELLRFWRAVLEESLAALEKVPGLEKDDLPDTQSETLKALWLVKSSIIPTQEGMLTRGEDLPHLEKAARLAPQSPAARLLLAEARLQAGLPEQCAQSCGDALRLKPDMYRARYVRALALMRLGQLALAEDDLNAVMAADMPAEGTDAARRLRARGAVRLLRGNHRGMCEDFTAACSLGDCDGLVEARDQGHCRTGVNTR